MFDQKVECPLKIFEQNSRNYGLNDSSRSDDFAFPKLDHASAIILDGVQ